ncbi:NACHT domain-containing protein [Solihabitans fulvus]|uniref:NACHT domain-containing protein n=1 Tax=Solihabitans fulvus TaxID=1892852 RepID=A0A5B2WN56_9PSEU|nr:AfsR/SARP family transcriptional regulator [Solihabitans fulvus]KAA2252404.1 NACHT domain-containing protein [Solihabitans fulvus]
MTNDGFSYCVLGQITVGRAGREIELRQAKLQAVLAILLLHLNKPVPVTAIIDAVWEENPPRGARNAVQTYVSRLRQTLQPGCGPGDPDVVLVSEDAGYLLRGDPAQFDAAVFEHHLTLAGEHRRCGDLTASAAEIDAALVLWRGDPFGGLGGSLIDTERQRLREHQLSALELRAQTSLDLGEHTAAIAELIPLVGAYPLRERLRALLMLALHRAGRRADALAVFQDTRRQLAEELGIDPGTELRELHERILRGDVELARPLLAAQQLSAPAASQAGEPSADRVDRAMTDLATAVGRQWTAEVELRSLQRPEPVRVWWSSTGRPVAAAASAVLGEEGGEGRPEPLKLRGDLTDVLVEFRRLPARQLVVLGEPGAGKTVLAILLTLGLLGDRMPDEATPVLLPLSSWDPHRQHLHTWLAGKLVEEYPGLANAATYGPEAAMRLVREGRVLPVLDGLDETPPGLHAAAVDALDRAIAGGRPLVVTCRSAEYEQAVRHGGTILARAAVVEIEPVELDDAITFLIARQQVGDVRWQPVVEHLRQHRHGPLADTLSTPLMVDLVRTAYAQPASDPTELCDTTRFPDRATIEEHLLDSFVPAVYATRPPPPGHRSAALLGYHPAQAQQWLAFLANHAQRLHTRDLAWWRLVAAIPPVTRGIVLGLPSALMFALAGLLAGGPVVGVIDGLSTAVAACLANGLGTRPGPLRVEVRFRGTITRFLGRFAIGLLIALAFGFAWSLPIGVVFLLVAVFGFGIGLHVWLDTPADAQQVASPATEQKQDRVATLSYTLSFALSLGIFYAVALGASRQTPSAGAVGETFDGEAFYLGRALPAGLVTALLGWFAFRRPGSLGYGLAGAAVAGTAMPHHTPMAAALVAGALFGLAVGLTVAPCRSWGAFVLARTWLALRGQTPLRLTRFVDDAHRRGVLRQAGAVYQFRHARLQDRLASRVHQPPATATR